jgi:NHLM bacteriocin system ABC transporter ATP-binding protein
MSIENKVIPVEPVSEFDPSSPVFLEFGHSTVLLAEIKEDGSLARRVPVATFAAPAVINPGPAPSGWAWLVVRDATSQEIPLSEVSEESISNALLATFSVLGAAVTSSVTLADSDQLDRRSHPAFASGVGANRIDHFLWIQPVGSTATLAEVPIPVSGIPLTSHLFVFASDLEIRLALPLDEIELGVRVDSVQWLFHVAGSGALDATLRRDQVDRERVISAPKVLAEIEASAVRKLVGHTTAIDLVSGIGLTREPLVVVASVVAEQIGCSIRPPKGGLRGREGTAAVRSLAMTSGLFVRSVNLPEKWWIDTVEPMIGFAADGTPFALILRSRRGVIIDADGKEVDASSPEAPALISRAFVLSRPPMAAGIGVWSLLRFAARGEKSQVARVVLWALVVAAVSLTVPLASGVVFGEIIPSGDRTRLKWLFIALAIAAVAVLPVQIAQTAASARLEAEFSFNLQRGIWGRVLRSPLSLLKRLGPGDLVMRIMALDVARDQFEQSVIGALPIILAALFSVVILFLYIPALAVVAVVWGLVVLVVSLFFALRVSRAQRAVDVANGEVNGFLVQVLEAIPKLHVAGAEPRAFAAWAQRFRGAIGQELTVRASHQVLFGALVGTLSTAVLFAGVVLTDSGKDVGAFVAFQTTFSLFIAGIAALVTGIGALVQLQPSIERAAELMFDEPESGGGGGDPGPLRGDIDIAKLTFRYQPDMPAVLNELDLSVRSGEMLAIVGHSGSGKSTLIRLLLGFEAAETGSVLFDNRDLASLDIESVRRQIGVVLQDGHLMPGTIHQNLAGASVLAAEDAWRLAELVSLADDIRAMPMQLETMISLTGGAFSGGQIQRLLIARALASSPRLLFLDEATSALDNVTQRVVTHNLAELGITRIVIAHRLSTVVNADRIAVFGGGQVVEIGTYEDLMERKGAFYALATRQVL